MALFKIFKGTSLTSDNKSGLEGLNKKVSTATEGFCYFTTDDGKMYIDISNNLSDRVCLNANMADQLRTARKIKLTGDAAGEASFNGTADAEIAVEISGLDDLSEAVNTKATVGHGIYYGTCATAAGTAAKVVTLTDATGFKLATGSVVIVKFTNANSASSPTLNVNSTGAKAMKRYGTTNVSTSSATSGWAAGAVTIFVYDGTNWVRDYWSNSTYSQVSLGQGYGTCDTAKNTAAKVVTLADYALAKNGIVSVKFTYDVPANATMNINSKGAKNIYYKGAAIKAGIISAGDTATFIYDGTRYHLIGIDDLTLSDMGITATKEEINKLTDSIMTTTELNYLSGVTSNIQAQLNTLGLNKLDKTANAASATKLQTARKIKLTGDASGEASFNGAADAEITVEIPDLDTLGNSVDTINKSLNKEAYLNWGGKVLSGSVSPVDAASSYLHSANRFQFAKAAGITVEYSRDNGATFTDYGASNEDKIKLVSGNGVSFYIGKRQGTSSSVTVNTVQDQLRITLNATSMNLYTRLRKLLININTNYSKGCKVKVEKAMKGSLTTFSTIGTYDITGWSGWNSIPIDSAFGGGDSQTSNIAILRLTFSITSVTAGNYNNALTVLDIFGIGDTYWNYPSNMAKTGHIYTWDASQNTSFPAGISAAGNLAVAGTSSITGNTTLGGTLGVTGVATFNNTITAKSDITSDGSISAEGSIHAEGDISTPNATIEDNGYITGTWLRTTAATNATGNIAILKDGWIYYRTPAQTLNDIIDADGTLDLNTATNTPLTVTSDAAAVSYIQYKDKDKTSLGYIGFSAANTPAVYLNSGAKEIYHKGNLTLSSLGITATKEEINILDGTPVTSVELSYLSGVTSGIQTQINNLSTNKLNKTANAVSASKWASKMTLELSGDATGSASFDGSTKTTLNVEISALNNYVPLTGGTMTGNLFIQSTNPYVGFKNSTGATKGYIQYIESSDSYAIGAGFAKSLVINSSGSVTIPEGQTFTPVATNTGTIGTSDKKWNAMYATTFNGNATSATKATQDGDGKTISSTYLKLSGGTMTGDLALLTGDNDRFIIWDYSTSDTSKGASWRIGELGTGSSNTNYFVIQTTGSSTGSTETYANAMRIGMNNKDVAFFGDVSTSGDVSAKIITASEKFVGALEGNASSATTLQTTRTINGMSFNGSANVTNYGVCGTAAEVVAKTVTVGSTFVLAEGAQVVVKFTNANTATAPKLNVNGTGEKPIVQYGTTAVGSGTTTTAWVAGSIQTFTFDGTSWVRDYWSNTTYTTRPITQTVVTDNVEYPLLSRTTNAVTTSNGHAKFAAGVTLNPSTKTITATTFKGNLTGDVTGNLIGNVTGNVSGSSGSCTGNAATTTKLQTAQTITLTGDVTGSASFTGNTECSISATIVDDSHKHTDHLQLTALGQAIPQAADLDTYHTGGTYYSVNSDRTSSLLNCPVSGAGFKMVVIVGYQTARQYQFILSNSNQLWQRYYNDSSWSDWCKIWRQGNAVTGAVWNDYAECRESDCEEFGYVLMEIGDDSLTKTTERLSHFAGVSSDTWGFSQGETERARTPIAVAGRVLVYPYQDRNNYKPGDCVCAAPNGTVDIMTREEVINWPDRIVGTVSCVPEYDEWGGGINADRDPVKVNGRIWIKIR